MRGSRLKTGSYEHGVVGIREVDLGIAATFCIAGVLCDTFRLALVGVAVSLFFREAFGT